MNVKYEKMPPHCFYSYKDNDTINLDSVYINKIKDFVLPGENPKDNKLYNYQYNLTVFKNGQPTIPIFNLNDILDTLLISESLGVAEDSMTNNILRLVSKEAFINNNKSDYTDEELLTAFNNNLVAVKGSMKLYNDNSKTKKHEFSGIVLGDLIDKINIGTSESVVLKKAELLWNNEIISLKVPEERQTLFEIEFGYIPIVNKKLSLCLQFEEEVESDVHGVYTFLDIYERGVIGKNKIIFQVYGKDYMT